MNARWRICRNGSVFEGAMAHLKAQFQEHQHGLVHFLLLACENPRHLYVFKLAIQIMDSSLVELMLQTNYLRLKAKIQ